MTPDVDEVSINVFDHLELYLHAIDSDNRERRALRALCAIAEAMEQKPGKMAAWVWDVAVNALPTEELKREARASREAALRRVDGSQH